MVDYNCINLLPSHRLPRLPNMRLCLPQCLCLPLIRPVAIPQLDSVEVEAEIAYLEADKGFEEVQGFRWGRVVGGYRDGG
jgi:hypothetical protein